MVKKKTTKKQGQEKKSKADLEKFAIFFEQQNSKDSAKKIMWGGIILISLGVLFFVIYSTKMQINAFTWDQETLKAKDDIQQKWSESFDEQEKERNKNNIDNIKKQVSEFLQQITDTTTVTTSIETDMADLTNLDEIETPTNIQSNTSTTSTISQ